MAVNDDGFSIVESTPSPQVSPADFGASPTINEDGFPVLGAKPASSTPSEPAIHDESDRFTQSDPSDNWLQSAWKWAAEKPLTESLFGWGRYRQGAGGLERGIEKFATGLTTPLSLGLLAAFAPAGIVEGVAGSALKEGLAEGAEALGGEALSGVGAAAKIENYAKAVDAARKAQIAGKPIADAVAESTGGNLGYQEFLNYGQYLRNQGLKESDMLSESFARRVAAQGLRKAGLSAEKAQTVAKGAEALVNVGFGVQQVQGAVYAYPRVADLLQQGKYDDAAEYMVQAGAGTIFGALGLAGGLHTIPEIFSSLDETRNLSLSDETEVFKKIAGITDRMKTDDFIAAHQRGRQHLVGMMEVAGIPVPARLKDTASPVEEATSALRDIFQSKENKQKLANAQMDMFFALNTGNDRNLAYQSLKALAYAYKDEDWAKQLMGDFDRPQRTVEDIANEEKNDILRTKADVEESRNRLSGMETQINLLQHDIKDAPPDQAAEIQKQIDQLSGKKSAQEITHQSLIEAHKTAKEWQNPTEETYRRHYQKLYQQMNDAATESETVDEFNEKVRALGNYPQDIALLEEKFPNLKKQEAEKFLGEFRRRPELEHEEENQNHGPVYTAPIGDGVNQATVELRNSGKDIYVRWIGPEPFGGEPANLTPSVIYKLLRELKDRFPEAETVSGDRISGPHAVTGKPQIIKLRGGQKDWRQKFPPSTVNGGTTEGFPIAPWQDSAQHRALPADLAARVDKARAKNPKPEDKEYIRKVLSSYAKVAKGLNEKQTALYKSLREADDDNWAAGYNNDLIHSIVDNHIHHIWGPKSGVGDTAITQARSGSFSTNVMQARHRVYSTALEGLLAGRQLAVHDPAAIIEFDAGNIAEAAANRKFFDLVMGYRGEKGLDGKWKRTKTGTGLIDPEGMPAFIIKGQGSVVEGEDGTPSAVLVNPDKVRNIHMTPADVSRLTASGLLDTYIKDGRVVDQTPSVHQDNVQDWMKATKKKIDKLITQNPLLPEKQKHEAAWANLQDFAKTQAQKIADYLGKKIKEIEEAGTSDGMYNPLSEADKPTDFAMSPYLKSVLFGDRVGGKITKGDLSRLKQYAQRNWQYALGESSYGKHSIRPSEISRLIQQEKQFLSPELKAYLDEQHDLFSTDKSGKVLRGPNGEWSKAGLTTALKYIHHAVTDEEYPRLVKDMSDLNRVDKVYTSTNPITQEEHKTEAEQLLKDINDRQEKKYLWAPKQHITIDHPSFHNYNWMATAADGTPTLAKSDLAVSRYYYKWLKNRLGLETSALRSDEGIGKITKPILEAGAKVKSTILSGSPFHIIQEMLRAMMLHVNPFVRPNPVAHLDESFNTVRGQRQLYRLGVENGLTLFSDKKNAEDMSVGVASHVDPDSVLRKVPGLNQYINMSDQIHDLLFNRLIPTYKASGFRKMFDKYAEAHDGKEGRDLWTDEAVAKHAAEHVNNAFGGQNWREMGRSSTTQDWFNLLALAPDWLESEMRFAAGLFRGYGIGPAKYEPDHGPNFSRKQVLQTAVVMWSTARLLNLLYSGNAHYETPFGLATKDKNGREIEFSFRTMPTDVLHMATDPSGFLIGRESPFVRTGLELYTGRNQYGQKLSDGEKYVDLVSNLVPIWGQAGIKQATHLATSADVPGWAQLAKAGGATANVYRTPAQKTAANLASERSEEGSMNPASIMRHRLLLELEDNLRTKRISPDDVTKMVDNGQLPQADAKTVLKNVKETGLLDPEQARMYSRVSRLDFVGADSVFQDANPEEKQILYKMIIKKAKSYIKKSLTDETPQTRAVDPMYKKARQYVPLEGPTE